MAIDHRARIAGIRRFDQLVAYLRDEMGWPIESADFEDLTFDYTPEELGIDAKNAAKIQEIKRLRPLAPGQPWGIFFVKFEPKRLPVIALRRILSQVALKKRASANKSEQQAWAADDLLFISNYGEDGERRIAFAHFAKPIDKSDLPTLKVLGWDNLDTPLHLDDVADKLVHHLSWPEDTSDEKRWRARWRGAFVLRHGEVVSTSRDLSMRLAELARAIRDRINTAIAIETDKGPLTKLMKAFQTTLVHDLTTEGFADMYAQTIAYGLLSSRITDPQKRTADDFAAHMRTNPFLRELMETFLKVGGRKGKKGGAGIDFDELGVSEVVELLDHANMEAVIRDFGDRNPQEDPVIHFYELFLKEYDSKKRMQRGVFYTPRPVVSYIVRSIDQLLRTEFGLEDGLADTTTWGEMVKRHKDLKIPDGISPEQDFIQILDPATGTGTFLVEVIDLIHAALVQKWRRKGNGPRKIEELWNEYVPRHLLPRLYGYELLMAPYAIAHLKVGLKLYETGYQFASDERVRVFLTNGLEGAHDFSDRFEFAIPALAQEALSVGEIKTTKHFTVVLGNPPYSRSSSNKSSFIEELIEPYKTAVKAEKNIQPLSDDYIKFLRLSEFLISRAQVGVLGMITNNTFLSGRIHRGMRESFLETFSHRNVVNLHGSGNVDFLGLRGVHDENVFDIQQGVCISVCARWSTSTKTKYVELIGSRGEKYQSLSSLQASLWAELQPAKPYFLLIPRMQSGAREYEDFVSLKTLFRFCSVSGKPGDDDLLVSFRRPEVLPKLEVFLDSLKSASAPKLTEAGRNIAAQSETLRLRPACIIDYAYRPFDTRAAYFQEDIWTRAVSSLKACIEGSPILLTTKIVKDADFAHAFVSRIFTDVIFLSNTSSVNCYSFPLYVHRSGNSLDFGSERTLNLDRKPFVQKLGVNTDVDSCFNYIYALLYSPFYRHSYFEALQYDFPCVPLTANYALFELLAKLGGELIACHLLESSTLDRRNGEYIGPSEPKVEKVSWIDNVVWFDKARTVGIRGVSEAVWRFRVGGYQVCEKWLKDRKGRTLSQEDISHYQKIVIAISETIRLMKEIDEVIDKHGGWPDAFRAKDSTPKQSRVVPFRPRAVQATPKERYCTCVPLIPLKVAAGAFSAPQAIDVDSFDWVEVDTNHRLREGMFVSQVVGRSMEPLIPDGSYCLFRSPVEGTRQGKTVLVQLRDVADPDTSQSYTVKRYKSDKSPDGDSWCHERITLEPLNPDFNPIVMTDAEEGSVQVVAEFVEVLSGESD